MSLLGPFIIGLKLTFAGSYDRRLPYSAILIFEYFPQYILTAIFKSNYLKCKRRAKYRQFSLLASEPQKKGRLLSAIELRTSGVMRACAGEKESDSTLGTALIVVIKMRTESGDM